MKFRGKKPSKTPEKLRGTANSADMKFIGIRLTSSEEELLKKTADELRIPVSTFLRNAALVIAIRMENGELSKKYLMDIAAQTHRYAYGVEKGEEPRIRRRIDAWGNQI
jgi:hypothetical protein